ncbi:hypothetical protein ACCUM_1316 [Candidatus Accumulibacter phosphatis]|uniref:Uncharacterized protein n=1 Tax=Candidatus Accumulibacter phosphatis TaxID=327160 RepID=A0A5S4EGR2_9PROT|nr:hypothetical protein ACCUM_1316 [Candidatus Accumulibacter phosphatis]
MPTPLGVPFAAAFPRLTASFLNAGVKAGFTFFIARSSSD